MSGIADIVWRGFGSWSTIVKVTTRGYGIGVPIIVESFVLLGHMDTGAILVGAMLSGLVLQSKMEGEAIQ